VADGLSDRFFHAVRTLAPGYGALVMAIGIVSVGMELIGQQLLSDALLWLAIGAFAVLIALTVARMAAYRRALMVDFVDPRRAFGFLTFVAGLNVITGRLALRGDHRTALVLFLIASGVGLVLSYVVPWTAVLGHARRPVLASANGTWFVWVVASQSVSVAAATLQPDSGAARPALALVAVLAWSVGLFLYAAAGIFVALRMMQYRLRPADLTESYWVAMGACAITVLAGTRIVVTADAPMVTATRGLVAGVSVVFWAFASWLIPVLAAETWWRHRHHRVPLGYDHNLWSMVFPVGMYGVCAIDLGRADGLPIVHRIGDVEVWVALAVLAVVFIAMCGHLARTVLAAPR
jgi:tellurite resistance protein TehA-like permease